MPFTYAGQPSTGTTAGRRDAVRLLLKDTSTANGVLFQDAEIAFFLTHHNNNVWRAAASAAQGLAAREAESKSVGDLAISGFGKSWRDIAEDYKRHADSHVSVYAGGISVSDKQAAEQDTDRVAPAFTRTTFQYPGTPTVLAQTQGTSS